MTKEEAQKLADRIKADPGHGLWFVGLSGGPDDSYRAALFNDWAFVKAFSSWEEYLAWRGQ